MSEVTTRLSTALAFLVSLREEPRFKDLMAYAREEYERVDLD